MKEDIIIPQMGESITEAIIGTILKPSGSAVDEGDEIIELETEKVAQILYASTRGVVSWSVNEGDEVAVGARIGAIDTEAVPSPQAEGAPQKKEEIPKIEGLVKGWARVRQE